jgi:hypothetical protein
MFSNLLKTRLPGDNRAKTPQPRSSVPPRLEELESRLAPVGVNIYTDIVPSVQIIPNFFNLTVTEKVTANVTTMTFGPLGNLTGASLNFSLNNQQQQATVDSSGHATATFTMSMLALFTGQTLTVQYPGNLIIPPLPSAEYIYHSSTVTAPLYLNFDNLLFPAALSFNTLVQQPTSGPGVLKTAQGETDDFGLFSFQYVDPGIIASVQIFGLQFPGFFAAALGAYGPAFMNNGSSPAGDP